MQEPSNILFLAVAAIVAWAGPVVGPFILLIFSAAVGSALAMGEHETRTRKDGAKFIAMGVAISFVLTGLAVHMVEKYTDIPGNVALMPLSFAIAVSRKKIVSLIYAALDACSSAFSAFANRKGNGQ